MTDTTFKRVVKHAHTPASWGCEITETSDGVTSVHSLVNPRGTRALWFAMKVAGAWSSTLTITNPERFLPGAPPKSQKEWMAVVTAWTDANDASRALEESPA